MRLLIFVVSMSALAASAAERAVSANSWRYRVSQRVRLERECFGRGFQRDRGIVRLVEHQTRWSVHT